jgi:hypothetical protein
MITSARRTFGDVSQRVHLAFASALPEHALPFVRWQAFTGSPVDLLAQAADPTASSRYPMGHSMPRHLPALRERVNSPGRAELTEYT